MKTSLYLKLAVAFILVAAMTGLVFTLIFHSLNANRLDEFVLDQQTETTVSALAEYYQEAVPGRMLPAFPGSATNRLMV